MRAWRATMSKANTIAATATAMAMRRLRVSTVERRSKRSGSLRRTSTNSTVDSVSMAACVRARSGAPCDDEQGGHPVADGRQEQHGGEPAARRSRPAAHHRSSTMVIGICAGRPTNVRPARPFDAAEQGDPRQHGGGGQDDAGVDRQRAVLDDGSDPVGHPVEPVQQRRGRPPCRWGSPRRGRAPGRPAGGRRTARPPTTNVTAVRAEGLVEPVPQRQVLGLAAWIEGDASPRRRDGRASAGSDAGDDRQHAEHGSGSDEPQSEQAATACRVARARLLGCGVRTCSVPARNRWGNTVSPTETQRCRRRSASSRRRSRRARPLLAENGPSVNAA